MKKLYNSFLRFLFLVPLKVEILKTCIAEWIAILRKAPLYRNVKWTKQQQKEFDEFWKKNYGKKISNRWHRLYEASNGVHRIDYMPEIIYSTVIEPKVNNYTYSAVFSDKSLNDVFFNNKLNGVRTPKSYLVNSYGMFYDSQRHIISMQDAIDILSDIGVAVIKPTIDSSSGKDVIIVNMKDGINLRDGRSAKQIIEKYKANFIVQEKITASKELSTLYPNSINTIRAISYIIDDSVEVAPLSLRIGGSGSEVDNIHAGGLSISVSKTGDLAKYAYRLSYGNSFEKFEFHPDTNINFENYRLSFIEKLISAAKCLHEITADIEIISWDFTVDSNGDIVIIEANLKGQSVWFPQMLSGKSLFGENTARFLNKFKKKNI